MSYFHYAFRQKYWQKEYRLQKDIQQPIWASFKSSLYFKLGIHDFWIEIHFKLVWQSYHNSVEIHEPL